VLASPCSPARTADGRFAPGHSGNPTGRPKGAKNRGVRLVDALRQGEGDVIMRVQIERALGGDPVAGRFCAVRLDAAAKEDDHFIELGLDIDDALNPFLFHAKLVHAVAVGRITPERARAALEVLAMKKHLSQYDESELSDEEMEALEAEARSAGKAASIAAGSDAEADAPAETSLDAVPSEVAAAGETNASAGSPQPSQSADAAASTGQVACDLRGDASGCTRPVNHLLFQAEQSGAAEPWRRDHGTLRAHPLPRVPLSPMHEAMEGKL
jgi:hypothetical protein